MLRTLRGRLIASNVGLLLLVVPLVGLALVYVLETQVVLPNLARQLTGQAVLVAELLKAEPAVWRDETQAAAFVARISPLFPGQLMLLSADGVVLASSDPADAASIGQPTALPGLAEARAGRHYSRVVYSRDVQAEVADVMAPVVTPDGQVAGIVRLTDIFGTVAERFWRVRALTAGVLAAGLVLGAIVGLILALTIERPLAQLTRAVNTFSEGSTPIMPPEAGSLETRTLLRAFRRMIEQLQSLEEARRHLLANLVHEIGRPLAALRAGGRALLDGAAEDVALREELLVGMDGEISRMDVLLQELADLHERAMGELELERRPIRLGEWLPQFLGPWRATARDAGLRWETDIAADLPELTVDPGRLGQALGNLLSNAIKFAPRGSAISVACGLDDDAWWFRVTDTGPGIPPDEQARIFEPFYRTPPDRHYPQGLGLGLTIARDIIAAHGGEISVESAPGRGSSFTVRLPLAGGM